jgi:hypothetical protein
MDRARKQHLVRRHHAQVHVVCPRTIQSIEGARKEASARRETRDVERDRAPRGTAASALSSRMEEEVVAIDAGCISLRVARRGRLPQTEAITEVRFRRFPCGMSAEDRTEQVINHGWRRWRRRRWRLRRWRDSWRWVPWWHRRRQRWQRRKQWRWRNRRCIVALQRWTAQGKTVTVLSILHGHLKLKMRRRCR